jgi:hypothetical protein
MRGAVSAETSNGIEFTNLKSLFGAVLVNGEPLISNDPANDPRRGGLPSGHPPLNSFMGIPIHVGERMVGMIGIANRPGGYDDEVCDFLRPFVTTCGTILEAISIEIARQEAENRLDMAMRGADLALWEWDIQKEALGALPEAAATATTRRAPGLAGSWPASTRKRMVTAAFTRHFSGELPVVECEHRVQRLANAGSHPRHDRLRFAGGPSVRLAPSSTSATERSPRMSANGSNSRLPGSEVESPAFSPTA